MKVPVWAIWAFSATAPTLRIVPLPHTTSWLTDKDTDCPHTISGTTSTHITKHQQTHPVYDYQPPVFSEGPYPSTYSTKHHLQLNELNRTHATVISPLRVVVLRIFCPVRTPATATATAADAAKGPEPILLSVMGSD
jgi:hypothetical protein